MALVAADRARERPDEVALRDDRVALGWAEVNDILNRVSNGLHALDLGPAQRVAVYAENSVETVLAHLGGLLAGASTVPVNFHLTADETAYILRDSAAAIVFTGPENVERAVAAAAEAGVPMVVAWRSEPPANPPEGLQAVAWDDWLAEASDTEPPTDVAPRPNLMYTSGTTGFPKGVDLPPTMFAGGRTVAEHVQALQKNRFATLGTHLVVGPMYHTGPLNGLRILAAGTPVAVVGKFDPEKVLASIEQYRTQSSVMVPTHFKRLLDLPDDVRSKYDVSSMQLIAHTGAACPIDVKYRMIQWFGPILVDAYGATEVGTTCQITSPEWLEHPGSVGRAIPPFSALVVDDDGEPVPAGTEGRIFFEDSTGRGVVYPNDPEKTAAAHLRPGVFTLGEIGYIDPDGYVYITDRSSDMVVSGGVNIYPAEAEKVLLEHPKVADVAVIGVPDRDMGEAVRALIVPQDPADPPTADELSALCRQHLAGYKCPRSYEIVSTIGRNAMGKVNKRALRTPYWEGSRTIG
jgi:acyl-CoA synthetase (AMP-forming)/AMP-acid ligase II